MERETGKRDEEKKRLTLSFSYSFKMLRRTAAKAAAASAPSSSCGTDCQKDHEHEHSHSTAKRPPAQQQRAQRRSVSERTMVVATAITGGIVFSLARHSWSSASSSGEFERTHALFIIRERDFVSV